MFSYLQGLSIRTKVITGFGVMVLVIGVLGFASAQRLSSLNTRVQDMSDNYVSGMGELAEMRVAMLPALDKRFTHYTLEMEGAGK